MINKPHKRDWNQIDYQKIKDNDPKEYEKLYNLTKPYLLWKFNGNEDYIQDWNIYIVKYVHTYDPAKSLFHSWLCKVADSIKSYHYHKNRKRIDKQPIDDIMMLDRYVCEVYDSETENMYTDKLNTLSQDDLNFVRSYINLEVDRQPKNRNKFSRIKKKLNKK